LGACYAYGVTLEIVRKLNDHIADGLRTEACVVYLFVELGKLMEREGCEPDYPVLKFYRDWIVHARIEFSRTGATVLQRMAEIVSEQIKDTDTEKMRRDVTEALSFERAREQGNALIERFGGGRNLLNDERWRSVVPLLLGVISDIPLTIAADRRQLAAARDALRALPVRGTSVVEKLALIKVPSRTFKEEAPADEITFCIRIDSTGGPAFVVPIVR
jgi:hypothetical protein